jgi:hypothetical protein
MTGTMRMTNRMHPDFIPSIRLRAGINYNIKYRMGQDAGDAVET